MSNLHRSLANAQLVKTRLDLYPSPRPSPSGSAVTAQCRQGGVSGSRCQGAGPGPVWLNFDMFQLFMYM